MRGVKGRSDPQQRIIDLMKRDGHKWCENPDLPGTGQWVPKGWQADFKIGHPVFEISKPRLGAL